MTYCSLVILGISSGNLSFWLWLLAALGSAFMLLRGYLLCSWLIGLRGAIPLSKGLSPSKPGDLDAYRRQPKSTAMEIAKMMLLLAAVLGAYKIGTEINYSKDYAAWKARNAVWIQKYGQENRGVR